MITEDLFYINAPMPHHKMGLSYTVSGYGPKIPMSFLVYYMDKWRRAYACHYGNSPSLYVEIGGKKHWLRDHGLKHAQLCSNFDMKHLRMAVNKTPEGQLCVLANDWRTMVSVPPEPEEIRLLEATIKCSVTVDGNRIVADPHNLRR